MNKKRIIPFMLLPFILFGCGKNKNVYASSKNTIYEFTLDGDDAIITGLNSNYKNQTDIIIPYSIDKHVVKRIENHSFEDVYRIKNVDMTKSKVEEIGQAAFKKCTNLLHIDYTDTITKIEANCFEECTSLTSMDLSKCNLTEISDGLFTKCSGISSVTFPKTTKVIGSNIFTGCDGITEIDYSEYEIEEIGEKAFYNLTNLKDVTLSPTTKKIGAYAFAESKKIQFLNFSNTEIEEIGEGAFSNCKALANINLPNTVKTLGNKAFYYCSVLRKVDLSRTAIESIPEACFELCRYFDADKNEGIKITLPIELKAISAKAFYNSSLQLINISKTVNSIADDAFRLCNKLEKITVDENNLSYIIHKEALYTANKEKLLVYPAASKNTEFEVSQDTKTINAYAFADAVNLKTVNLESVKLTEIAGYTFMNCTSLTTVVVGADAATGIKKIGTKAFFGCKALTSFNGEYSVLEIGESAFYDCISLKEVYLGESTSLSKIDAEAFYNCNKLETLTLPGSLEIVGRAAFYNCGSVTSFTFGANKTAFDTLVTNNPDSGLDQFRDLI